MRWVLLALAACAPSAPPAPVVAVAAPSGNVSSPLSDASTSASTCTCTSSPDDPEYREDVYDRIGRLDDCVRGQPAGGRVWVELSIADDGKPCEARAIASRDRSPKMPDAVEACVVSRLRALGYPRPGHGCVRLEIPIGLNPPPPPLDVATCAQKGGPTYSGCSWTVGLQGRCGGAALRHEPPPTQVCVCNGCSTDTDCTARAGGKCESFTRVCAPAAKACVYPGDLCFQNGAACAKTTHLRPGNRTPEPRVCSNDGHGHAVCGPMQAPPP